MRALLGELINGLPAGAYVMYLVLFALTFGLVRCSMHPTFFALVAWPGTLAHELSHAAVGLVLGAKPSSMSLWPKSLGGGRWQLGSVEFTNLKWWNAPWTALAPMLLAPLSLAVALIWAYPVWAAGDFAAAGIALYVCATMLQASWPSSKDFEVALPGLAIIGLVVAWLW
ncbi:hypothetical protein WL29_20810 [Burkholderia ubonensis]|uniref:Peptidase M50 n=1 Tax=Burkholderia ubonensis TaxID=101571 RepID=A0A106QCL3_9BURK|nr:hypothetical protein [Burkholderia ubonensis]KWA83808.1 hypothetical protein WL29_20810 [Burkholderia ubonensis]